MYDRVAQAPLAPHQPVEAQAKSDALSPGGVFPDGDGIWWETQSCSLDGSQM